jgi:hypothetical protein
MDYLWSPQRYRYISQAGKGEGYPFCEKVLLDPAHDRKELVLVRSKNWSVSQKHPQKAISILLTF